MEERLWVGETPLRTTEEEVDVTSSEHTRWLRLEMIQLAQIISRAVRAKAISIDFVYFQMSIYLAMDLAR